MMNQNLVRGFIGAATLLALAPGLLPAQTGAAPVRAQSRAAPPTWPTRSVVLVLKEDPLDSTIAVVIRSSESAPDEVVIGGAIKDDREIALAFATWRSLVASNSLGAPESGVLRTNLRPMGNPTLVSTRLTAWATEARRSVRATAVLEDDRFGPVRRAPILAPR